MSQTKDYKRNTGSYGYHFAQCEDSDKCTNISADNRNTCKHYIPAPSCTACCSGPFCNYNQISRRYLRMFIAIDAGGLNGD